MNKKTKGNPPAKAKKRMAYAAGGKVGIKPTNQTVKKARGAGAATRGTSFKD